MKIVFLIILFLISPFNVIFGANECNHISNQTCEHCRNSENKESSSIKEHLHDENEPCNQCSKEHVHNENEPCSQDSKDMDQLDNHEHNGPDECNLKYHDKYLLDEVLEEPWRHPDKLKDDMWIKTGSLLGVLIAGIFIRPVINKIIKGEKK